MIATDRPAVTDSSAVVPDKVFQAENGLLDTGNQARRTLDFPETLIRVGIGPSTELRFTAPDYYQDYVTPVGLRSGFGDLALGVKQQLPSPFGFEVAAVLSLSLPTGAAAISSHGYDPSFQLPWSHPLSSNWTAAGMLSVYAPTQNGSHSVVGETTFLVDRQLTKDWDAFTEYAGDFPQAGGPRHLLHFGTAYKITRQQQLDLHVGVGLSAAAVDHFIGIGYSFRFRMGRR
ncbi:MAG TPA: transporter [Bryobacteraceae bacterium]|nr:transporter [Bryobacteraceae bacterium]